MVKKFHEIFKLQLLVRQAGGFQGFNVLTHYTQRRAGRTYDITSYRPGTATIHRQNDTQFDV